MKKSDRCEQYCAAVAACTLLQDYVQASAVHCGFRFLPGFHSIVSGPSWSWVQAFWKVNRVWYEWKRPCTEGGADALACAGL